MRKTSFQSILMQNTSRYRKKGRDNVNRFRPDIFLKARGMVDTLTTYVPRVGIAPKKSADLPIHISRSYQ